MKQRILFLILLSLPGWVLGWLWVNDRSFDDASKWGLLLLVLAWSWCWGYALMRREDHPMRTLSNLLSSLREGDYSIQARTIGSTHALKEVFLELNTLVEELRQHRLGSVEASTLLQKILDEMDVVVLAFDSENRVLWANPAALSLLVSSEHQILGTSATSLHMEDVLTGSPSQTLELHLGGRLRRWGMRRRSFREKGKLHQLVVLNDLSHALRDEERLAWKRLIRVMGHELNNSLAPIVSITKSLESLLDQQESPDFPTEDFQKGLQVIHARTGALGRFVDDYGKLARLPEPKVRTVSIQSLVEKCVSLESRVPVAVQPDEDLNVRVDPDQVEQFLINLLSNAADACLIRQKETLSQAYQPTVECGWKKESGNVLLFVQDNGTGMADSSNLFVPFFTTKPNGSGIGLALCRQIAEGHDATLQIVDRTDASGCVASLRLPLP